MATKIALVRAEEGTNIAAQITRIQTDRDTIRAKLVSMSLAESSDNLDTLASVIDSIPNIGAVQAEVKEGESYTIPKGYHNGSGVVKGVSGGGNYNLQTKTATPTKMQQNITSDEGYYGLSSVTIEPIPKTYQDVTGVTAVASDVLSGKVIVLSNGAVTPGTMPNNGSVSKVLDTNNTTYTIPIGYHDGTGEISIVNETKTVTPTKLEQSIEPTSGKVLSSVTVYPIPSNYIDTTDATATSSDIKEGLTAYIDSEKVTGTMPIIEAVENTVGADNPTYMIPEGYHDGTGKVTVSLETKVATPTKEEQTIVPNSGKALSSVTVNAIPDEYITTTDADAIASDIKTGATAYVNGIKITGTMPIIEGDSAVLFVGNTSYNIEEGYHDGTGTISISTETKSVIPSKSQQKIEPTVGKVLSSVVVEEIPSNYIDTTDATATENQILIGNTAYVGGIKITGTMPNNGATSLTIDGMLSTSVDIPLGYTTGGTVSLTNSIEDALSAI